MIPITKIITFEGIDGTGKGTQAEILHKTLTEKGINSSLLSFPLYDTFFGEKVGEYLSGKDNIRADQVDGKSMALWFALDRFEKFQNFDYLKFDVLLINRYVLSNAVYQSIRPIDADKPDILDFIIDLEFRHFHIPEPDMMLLFDMDFDTASRNVAKKGFRDYVGDGKDIYESIPDIQKQARNKYIQFANKMNNVKIIQCMENGMLKSRESIAEDVLKKVSALLQI